MHRDSLRLSVFSLLFFTPILVSSSGRRSAVTWEVPFCCRICSLATFLQDLNYVRQGKKWIIGFQFSCSVNPCTASLRILFYGPPWPSDLSTCRGSEIVFLSGRTLFLLLLPLLSAVFSRLSLKNSSIAVSNWSFD